VNEVTAENNIPKCSRFTCVSNSFRKSTNELQLKHNSPLLSSRIILAVANINAAHKAPCTVVFNKIQDRIKI
jgi:hypothetical protein